MKITGRILTLLLFPLLLALIAAPAAPRLVTQEQDECERQHPWQHKVNGACVDKPGVVHYHGNHSPEAGERCWIECLCRRGEYPSGNTCGPCSYVGTVCLRR